MRASLGGGLCPLIRAGLYFSLEFHESRAIATCLFTSLEFQVASSLLAQAVVSPQVPPWRVYLKLQHFSKGRLCLCSAPTRAVKPREGKVWCKIRRRKCETGFTRVVGSAGATLVCCRTHTQAKVVNVTMAALRHQDSGRVPGGAQLWHPLPSDGLPCWKCLQVSRPAGALGCWGVSSRPVVH